MKIFLNAEVWAPQPLGVKHVLVEGEKIAAIEADATEFSELIKSEWVEVIDLAGAKLVPGYVDLHVHITGGGGEDGFASRTPEINFSEITRAGVTTLVGTLGTDSVTRSLENLLAKANALRAGGLSCYTLTGAYRHPSNTLLGSVERDIVLLDHVVGVKIALSDHRGSQPSLAELIALGLEVRRAGILSRKAGYITAHIGKSPQRLDLIFQAVENSALPASVFLPTHIGRDSALIDQGIAFTQLGGLIDFTASEVPSPEANTAHEIIYALEHGANPAKITLSSDGNGSLPRWNSAGECIGLTFTSPQNLHRELQLLVQNFGLDLTSALSFLTSNPAQILKKTSVKGAISVGADADLLILDSALEIQAVYAQGRLMVQNDQAIVKGPFE